MGVQESRIEVGKADKNRATERTLYSRTAKTVQSYGEGRTVER